MSGVFPGTRTQIFQRLRLIPLPAQAPDREPCWALLLWFEEPPACRLFRQESPAAPPDVTPLLHLDVPQQGDLNARLQDALAASGWQALACGACRHWRHTGMDNADGLPMGECSLHGASSAEQHSPAGVPPLMGLQSFLALGCPFWDAANAADPTPESAGPAVLMRPLPRIAQISESKLKPWPRLRLQVRRWLSSGSTAAPPEPALAERSGVGAGTEPCFACQGRIANLGSLTADSGLGDKETFSVWRCRSCHTLYLSDWVDRWERVDSLETEETIFRLAPVEAARLLELFAGVKGGDHPARRHERDAQRDWIKQQMAGRNPVSHLIKQGR